VKLDQWCKEEMYEKYATELIRKEGVETALERTITTMSEWAEENNSVWNHYFLYASPNRVIWHIRDGKVSPWLMLNCKSGKEMLSKFNDEQLNLVYHVLDPQHWALRFKRQKDDVQLVKDVVKRSKL
jgi:uroporphyrinogen-III decarboxylase